MLDALKDRHAYPSHTELVLPSVTAVDTNSEPTEASYANVLGSVAIAMVAMSYGVILFADIPELLVAGVMLADNLKEGFSRL